MRWSRRYTQDERGAGLVEYALLVSLIALAAFAAVTFVGENTSNKLEVMGVCLEQGGGDCVEAAEPTNVSNGGAKDDAETVPPGETATTTVPAPTTTVPETTTTTCPGANANSCNANPGGGRGK